MAITLVQSTKKVVTGVNNTTLAYGSNLTAGNLACNTHTHYINPTATITTPTDTLTHTYVGMTAEQSIVFGADSVELRSFYKENCSAGADTVTFDINGAGTGQITCVIAEFNTITTASALDKTQVGGPTLGTAADSGATATTTQADELIWGAMTHDGSNRTLTETGSATIVQENEGGTSDMPLAVSYRVVSATGAYHATWTIGTGNVNWIGHVATFKATAAGGPTAAQEIGIFDQQLSCDFVGLMWK